MTVGDWLVAVNDALRGTDEDSPTIASEEADYWIRLLNRKKSELFSNPRVLFDESFELTAPNEPGTVATTGTTALTGTGTYFTDYRVGDKITVDGETVRTIATITSNTALTVTPAFSNTASGLTFTRQTIVATSVSDYSAHRLLIAPADYVHIVDTSSNNHYFDLVKARQRPTSGRKFYLFGMYPTILSSSSSIASTEDIVGGELRLPGYYMPADMSLTDDSDEVRLPDPYWGVLSVAAEVAGNDITYEDKEANLNAKSNALYMQMVRTNRRGTYGKGKVPPTNMYRIRSTEIN